MNPLHLDDNGLAISSKSCFSDSGQFISGVWSRLNDINIEIMMKLRSWTEIVFNKFYTVNESPYSVA